MMKNKYKQLLVELIDFHNTFVDAGEFCSGLMMDNHHDAIGTLLCQAQEMGIFTEQECDILYDSVKDYYGI